MLPKVIGWYHLSIMVGPEGCKVNILCSKIYGQNDHKKDGCNQHLDRGFDESWSSRCVTSKGLIFFDVFWSKTTKKRPVLGRFFVLHLAVPTGLGFATRNYLGAQ